MKAEQILYDPPQRLARSLDTELNLDGHKVQMVHRFGYKGLRKPPVFRKLAFDILSKLADKMVDGQNGFQPYAEKWIVQKWKEKYVPGFSNDSVYLLQKKGYGLLDIIRKLGTAPYEIHVGHGLPIIRLNLMLNEGLDQIWDLVDGTDTTNKYTNALARVGVGNSSTAAAATQTGLQGGSTAFTVMDATYPISTSQKINLKGSFADTFAEFAWEEGTADNGSSPNKNLNRLVQSKGTKPSGETWTSEVQITGS
jgi:hypothetical protein